MVTIKSCFSSLRIIIIFFLKESIGFIFKLFGGIYFINFLVKDESFFMVLNYHNFSKYNNFRFKRGSILETDYAQNFERQISFLNQYFNSSGAEKFFSKERKKGLNFLITFDDGYKDNYDIAAPILKKYNVPSIFFLTTNYIDSNIWLFHDMVRYLICKGFLIPSEAEGHLRHMNTDGTMSLKFKKYIESNFPKDIPKRMMMNWQEVIALTGSSIQLGSHTCNHVILSKLNFVQQDEEIKKSSQSIEDITNKKCVYFAYPNGLYNKNTLNSLKNNKFEYGFTTKPGINNYSQDKLQLKRIGVNPSDSVNTLILKIFLNILNDKFR